MYRRHFLMGAGGLTLGLPLLETFAVKTASAQAAPERGTGPFVLFVVNGNGVVQAGKDLNGGTDPEKYWPKATGALTTTGMAADASDRALGLLSPHAARLTMVRGINHPFAGAGCDHAGGDAQLLTASKLTGSGNKTQATGESVDSRIAREMNSKDQPDPLTLHAGRYSPGGVGFDIPGYISYVASKQPRTPDASPVKAYNRMVGAIGGDSAEGALITNRRKSINDLLRGQIQGLLGRADLSKSDRDRLTQHFDAVRDIEVKISKTLSDEKIASMKKVDPDPYNQDNHEIIIRLQMDLMVLAVSSGYTRVSTLKIGDREDDHTFTVDGKRWDNTFHFASHRTGTDALNRCILADRIHAGHFKYLLDQLEAVTTPTGTLIDDGVTIWTNQVAAGNHAYKNIPWVLAGSARGYFKTGQFVQMAGTGVTINRMHNTLLNAAGVRKAGGGVVDDFGDTSLSKGVIAEIVKS